MLTPAPPKRCLQCGYILEGLPEPRCPECGRRFDPCDRRTYCFRSISGTRYLAVSLCALLCIVGPAILCNFSATGGPSIWAVTSLGGVLTLGGLVASALVFWNGVRVLRRRHMRVAGRLPFGLAILLAGLTCFGCTAATAMLLGLAAWWNLRDFLG